MGDRRVDGGDCGGRVEEVCWMRNDEAIVRKEWYLQGAFSGPGRHRSTDFRFLTEEIT